MVKDHPEREKQKSCGRPVCHAQVSSPSSAGPSVCCFQVVVIDHLADYFQSLVAADGGPSYC